ncbi:MAG: extracellular solute-binding protein [Defluviitaleaceae bacterium]|nr:extracellular solute-binding protein [Defluviitaleaceae bacterium]
MKKGSIKMSVMIKLTALLVVSVFLLFSFAGCSNDDDDQVQETVVGADGVEREFFHFVMYMNYEWFDVSPVWGEDETSAYLMERFNISLELQRPDTDPDIQMNLLIAAGDLPDAMMLDRGSHYFTMAQTGMLYALDDLINAGSNYQRLLSQDVRNSAKINDVTYGILNWPTDETSPTGNNGFTLNTRIYEMLGSPSITNLDELYAYLLMVQEQVPTLDGAPIIPINVTFDDIYSLHGGYRGLYSGFGLFRTDDGLSLVYHDPIFVEAAHFMNRLFNEDLLTRDIFIQTNDQFLERLATGRVAAFMGNMAGHIAPSRIRLQEIDPLSDFTIISPPGAPGRDIFLDYFHTIGWNVLVINDETQKPDRIFELFDFLFSEEGTVVMYHGPRGHIWEETDAYGFPYLTIDVNDLSEQERGNLGLFVWSFPGNSIVANTMGKVMNERMPREEWDWGTAYQHDIIWPHSMPFTEFFPIVNDITLNDPDDPLSITRGRWQSFNDELIPRLVMAGSPEELDGILAQAIDEVMAMGFAAYEEHATELWRSR